MYFQLISVHGLIRGERVEMGRDADTGGQIRYVLELAKQLAEHPKVDQVDLFTRRLKDKRVSEDYTKEIETLGPKCRLVRIPCGGGRYIRKERLWPLLDEFVDGMIRFTRGEGLTPTVVHGHYADAGYVAMEVASAFAAPFVFTGHSLGRPKLDYLLEEGWSIEQADKELAISRRIEVEQQCIDSADLIITSTRHERDEQYGRYETDGEPNVHVIPPGTDLERFFPYYDYEMPGADIDERFKQARMRMTAELGRFHISTEKPLILALCRPDRRKNIGALVEAYGQSKELQAIANLAIFAGIREDIESMPENEQQVLTDMLLAMDRYNLYGKMAIPKNHNSEFDVPELYRLAAASRGVFANTAFVELFGLTAIEASAVGLPFVVTSNGGPQDIYENCDSGLLVNVNDQQDITQAILTLVTDESLWDNCSDNGVNRVREHYSWETHAQRYVRAVEDVLANEEESPRDPSAAGAIGRRLSSLDALLITDIDNTLLGDDQSLEALKALLADQRDRLGFGIASGRSLELVREALSEAGIQDIDVVISSVGSEIYYGTALDPDRGWASRLRTRWRPDRIREALADFDFLRLQERDFAQREFKISYDLWDTVEAEEALRLIREALRGLRTPYSLIFSHGSFVDVLPRKASKGKAIRHVAEKWHFPIEHVATAGDSGNDRDMLAGPSAGIVVGNHAAELASLRQARSTRVYFAEAGYAAGIIEGLQHYGIVDAEVAQASVAQYA